MGPGFIGPPDQDDSTLHGTRPAKMRALHATPNDCFGYGEVPVEYRRLRNRRWLLGATGRFPRFAGASTFSAIAEMATDSFPHLPVDPISWIKITIKALSAEMRARPQKWVGLYLPAGALSDWSI